MRKIYHTRFPKLLVLGLIFFSMTFTTAAFANQSRKQQNIRVLIKQARDAWVARDANAITQLFAPDGELIVPGKRWQGQAEIQQEVSRFAQQSTDVKIEIRRIIVEGNQAVVEWYYEDTEKATGLRHKADDAIIVDFKDGRISRWREYFDNKTLASKPSS